MTWYAQPFTSPGTTATLNNTTPTPIRINLTGQATRPEGTLADTIRQALPEAHQTVWCLFDYRDLDAIYATKEAAEAALEAAKGPNVLTYPDGREITGYHIEEWTVEA